MDRWGRALIAARAWRIMLVNSGDRARRFALLLAAFAFLSVTLVACQVTGANTGGSGNANQGLSFTTPNPANQTPTPLFPDFTIGAWPSNYSPQALDNITIYVLCRVQPHDMSSPATAPSPLTVTVQLGQPINQTFTGRTDANGLAAIQISFSDPKPGTPVTVTVYAQYNGKPYTNTTFFTPGATAKPSPSPSRTPTGAPKPTKTP